MDITVWTDGTCRPKLISKKKRATTGPSAAAAIIKKDGAIVAKKSKFVGELDNNQAEFEAFIMAIEMLIEMDIKHAKFFTDSNLVHKLMIGHYKGKAESIIPYIEKSKNLISNLSNWEIVWIPRGGNREADKLASIELDKWVEKHTKK